MLISYFFIKLILIDYLKHKFWPSWLFQLLSNKNFSLATHILTKTFSFMFWGLFTELGSIPHRKMSNLMIINLLKSSISPKNWAILKKQTGVIKDIRLWKYPGICRFFTLPLEMSDKIKLHHWKVCRIVCHLS